MFRPCSLSSIGTHYADGVLPAADTREPGEHAELLDAQGDRVVAARPESEDVTDAEPQELARRDLVAAELGGDGDVRGANGRGHRRAPLPVAGAGCRCVGR